MFLYRQWFGHPDAHGPVAGGFEDVHGVVQAGAPQVPVINTHEPVPGQQSSVPVSHAPGQQRADDQDRLGSVLRILSLPWEREHVERVVTRVGGRTENGIYFKRLLKNNSM